MFMPYFVDGAGRRHTFQDDFALKGGLLKALRKGEDVFSYRFRLKSSYSGGHDYELASLLHTRNGFVASFTFESSLGKETYCIYLFCMASVPVPRRGIACYTVINEMEVVL